MPDQVLSSMRSQLESERDDLRGQLRDLGWESTGPAFDENFADSGQVAAEQGETRVLAGSLSDQLREVERAIGKLEGDSFGQCETCGAPIAEARLEAMPATRYCISHA
jgi:RNA polymerase-binding transcription factor DksA